jgi:hypothetical protein
MYKLIFILPVLIGWTLTFSQTQNYQVGVNPNLTSQAVGGFYDYSDPTGLNIKVSVWGYVRFPGRYVIPISSTARDLLSYAGGVSDDALLDELRIHRVFENNDQELIKLNYESIWWNDRLEKKLDVSSLVAGDVLVVPGRQRLYWEDYVSVALSGVGFIVSLATLIITLGN